MFFRLITFMNLTRNYLDEDYSPGAVVVLGASSAHHLVRVLRKKEGDEIEVFDGKGTSCLPKILTIKPTEVTILIVGKISFSARQGISINLGQALIKPDPFNLSIQKATELGVDFITPLITERSTAKLNKESYDKKRQKWQVIAQGACEQCGQNWLPKINNPVALRDWSDELRSDHKIVLYPGAEVKISDIEFKNSVTLAIGPEGDFSSSEIESLIKEDYIPVSMGSRILRAETAVISALSTIRTLAGEF